MYFCMTKFKIMKRGEITTAIILEKRKPNKNGKYPVKLRVTFKREQRYYTLRNSKDEAEKNENASGEPYLFTLEEFSKINADRPREPYNQISIKLKALEKRAKDVINLLPIFTFQSFKAKFFSEVEDETDLLAAMRNTIRKFRNEGKISTAITYECTINSLQNFTEKKKIAFYEIDVDFLNRYEKWMLNNSRSRSTIGIYVRNIRTMFNKAISMNIVDVGLYPFGKNKYTIPTGRNIKKALTLEEVGLIANYPSIEDSTEQRYRDYWLFSYLCNGINIKDIALLKYNNISGDIITLVRAKTEEKEKNNPHLIKIVITPIIENIIKKWGNKPAAPDSYIFPIFEKYFTPEQIYSHGQQATKTINKYIDRIAKDLGIQQKVRTYTARHSFATVLKRSGASTEFIGESLAHSNLRTTENYLSDFELDEKRKWADKISGF